MRKAIALKKTDKELSDTLESVFESKQRFQQKMMFLKKQGEQAHKEFHDEQDPLWEEVKKRLRTLDLLPKDYKEGDTLSYDREGEVLYWIREESDGGDLQKFIKQFFGFDV
jgi:hypothetical protein